MSVDRAVLVITAILNKEHMAELKSYREGIKPVFMKYGARPVNSYQLSEQLMGEQGPEMIAVYDFADNETITTMINSADFLNLSELRARVFSKLTLAIGKKM